MYFTKVDYELQLKVIDVVYMLEILESLQK